MEIELLIISTEARISEIDLSSVSTTPEEEVRHLRTFCLFLPYALVPSDSQKLTQCEDSVLKLSPWTPCLQQPLDLVCFTTIDGPSVLAMPFL